MSRPTVNRSYLPSRASTTVSARQAGAHRPYGPGGADDHRLAAQHTLGVDLDQPEPPEGLVGRPESGGRAVAVAGGHRQRRAPRDGHAGVSDDLGERAEADDLSAE